MGFMQILKVVGGVAGNFFPYVPAILGVVEQIGDLLGKDKMDSQAKHDLAIALIKDVLMSAEGFSQKDIVDEEKFSEALDKIVHATVDALNASVWYNKK